MIKKSQMGDGQFKSAEGWLKITGHGGFTLSGFYDLCAENIFQNNEKLTSRTYFVQSRQFI